jgi:hypothetical protein
MAIVNLDVISRVSYVNSLDPVAGPRPILYTLKTFDDTEATVLTQIRRSLYVSPLSDFTITNFTGVVNTSSAQTAVLYNQGNSTITVSRIYFSENSVQVEKNFSVGNFEIPPFSNHNVHFYYSTTATAGIYNNYFTIYSNATNPEYNVDTVVRVGIAPTTYNVSPSQITETITEYGKSASQDFNVNITNGLVNTFTTNLDQGALTAFSIATTSTGFNVSFNPYQVSHTPGTYTGTVYVTVNNTTETVALSVGVDIDTSQYAKHGYWFSPSSYNNSIVGMSYDTIAGDRYLTIGVGLGADGSPTTAAGVYLFDVFADTDNLSVGAENATVPYAFWSTVYRIKLDGTSRTYNSIDYVVKTTDGLNYADYFGEDAYLGNMFFVQDDGYGNLTIKMNHLRELSGDDTFDNTLDNLTRSFYYYSAVDVPYRISQLSAPSIDGTLTTFFNGFYNNGRVWTTTVPLPR